MMRTLLKDQRGNSLIEMGLAAPILAALLLGMVDISRAVEFKLELVQVAQRTVERVQRDSFRTSNMAAFETEAETAAGAGSNATVTAWLECGTSTTRHLYTSSCAPGEAFARYMNVTVTRNFDPMFSMVYFPGSNNDGTFTMTGEAGVRVQ